MFVITCAQNHLCSTHSRMRALDVSLHACNEQKSGSLTWCCCSQLLGARPLNCLFWCQDIQSFCFCPVLYMPIPLCQNATENRTGKKSRNMKMISIELAWIILILGLLYSWKHGPNSNRCLQIYNHCQKARTLFYHSVLGAIPTKFLPSSLHLAIMHLQRSGLLFFILKVIHLLET